MKYTQGQKVNMKVVRKSDIGVFLDAETGNTSDDILLHNAQQTKEVNIGDTVEVELYLDPKKRLTASMKIARLSENQIGVAEVINVTKQGAFVDIGGERGVFLPFSQMRGRVSLGQVIFVKLYRDKTDRPAVSMLVEEDLKTKAKKADHLKIGEYVTGRIYNELEDGWLIFTDKENIAYLHKSETLQKLINIGDEITARITFIRDDGRINVSQRKQKENAMEEDSDKILAFLTSRGGSMPYADKTPPEIIKDKFSLSKAAFKRALGKLLKEGKIKQDGTWTMLVIDTENEK